jgi:hypothetical protein
MKEAIKKIIKKVPILLFVARKLIFIYRHFGSKKNGKDLNKVKL